MFTGIVKALCRVANVEKLPFLIRYSVELPATLVRGLEMGASVSVDGVCQSVVKIEGNNVWFDAIHETLNRTTLSQLEVGRLVNIERSARLSDEIGGHMTSGHVMGTAEI